MASKDEKEVVLMGEETRVNPDEDEGRNFIDGGKTAGKS
jgi:hypothetical protein